MKACDSTVNGERGEVGREVATKRRVRKVVYGVRDPLMAIAERHASIASAPLNQLVPTAS